MEIVRQRSLSSLSKSRAMQVLEKTQHKRVISRESEGGVQVKIVISKRELKKTLGVPSAAEMENLLHLLKRKHGLRWKPELQSIPEDILCFLVRVESISLWRSLSIKLPPWVHEEMRSNPDILYTDRSGRRNPEYISLGCDMLPVLKGRTPIQVYSDYMRSFRNRFKEYLGYVIVEIQVGLGPCGELRYPSYPESNGTWKFPGIGEFQCYDKTSFFGSIDSHLRAASMDIHQCTTIFMLPSCIIVIGVILWVLYEQFKVLF